MKTLHRTHLYAIQSKATGKFLSHLFEDTRDKMFQSDGADSPNSYKYNSLAIAEDIAKMELGKVVPVKAEVKEYV